MPRQDVPYGGAICRLRERIAEIFDKLGEKLHTINGVPGDGDGNVKIVSGSSAVVITDDPTQNEIAVSLDTSQLPAAAVSSVNGQTGAVALTADDVPSDNGDVQTDIDNLEAADTTLRGNINAEVLARQNADSTLQTNINAVSASLPAAAAAAVAADPTVAYINSELSNKVDLSDVSTVETPDTIAKRNGSGRLVAADPASGATDKTLVTANWVSQTGNSAPNNLVHKSGAETIANDKKFTGINTHKQLTNYNPALRPGSYAGIYPAIITDVNDNDVLRHRIDRGPNWSAVGWQIYATNNGGTRKSAVLHLYVNHANGDCSIRITTTIGNVVTLAAWNDPNLKDS